MKPTAKVQVNFEVAHDVRRVLKTVAAFVGQSQADIAEAALRWYTGERNNDLEQLHERCSKAAKLFGGDEPTKGNGKRSGIDGGPASEDLTPANNSAKSHDARALRERGLPFRDAVAESGITGMPAFA